MHASPSPRSKIALDLGLAPLRRLDAALAFDESRGEIVLLGGRAPGGIEGCGGFADTGANTIAPSLFGECDRVWRFDRTTSTWTADEDSNRPPARLGLALAYDRERERLVAIGGCDTSAALTCHRDVWEYDGVEWDHIVPDAPDPSSPHEIPPVSQYGSAAFHPGRGQIVFAAPYSVPQALGVDAIPLRPGLWAWDGAGWEALQPVATEPPPAATRVAVGAWGNGMVTFGGRLRDGNACQSSVSVGTHVWDGFRWRNREWVGLGSPRAVVDATLVADSERLLLTGGASESCALIGDECVCTPNGYTPGLWEFDGDGWQPQLIVSPGRAGMAAAFDDTGTAYFVGGYNDGDCLGAGEYQRSDANEPQLCWYATQHVVETSPLDNLFVGAPIATRARVDAAMAFDESRQEFLLFGGIWPGGVLVSNQPVSDTMLAAAQPSEPLSFFEAPDDNSGLWPDHRRRPSLFYADTWQSVLLFGGSVLSPFGACEGEWTGGFCRTPWRWADDHWVPLPDAEVPFGDGSGVPEIGLGIDGAVWDRTEGQALVLQSTNKLDSGGDARAELHSWRLPAELGPAHIARLPRASIGDERFSVTGVTVLAETGGRGGQPGAPVGAKLLFWDESAWQPVAWVDGNDGDVDALVVSTSVALEPESGPFNTLDTLHLALTTAAPNGGGGTPAVLETGYLELMVDYLIPAATEP